MTIYSVKDLQNISGALTRLYKPSTSTIRRQPHLDSQDGIVPRDKLSAVLLCTPRIWRAEIFKWNFLL